MRTPKKNGYQKPCWGPQRKLQPTCGSSDRKDAKVTALNSDKRILPRERGRVGLGWVGLGWVGWLVVGPYMAIPSLKLTYMAPK